MFLDERLKKIALDCELTETGIHSAIIEMAKTAMNDAVDSIGENPTNQIILAQFKRVNNTWKRVCADLEKADRQFVRSDGFESIVKLKFGEQFLPKP